MSCLVLVISKEKGRLLLQEYRGCSDLREDKYVSMSLSATKAAVYDVEISGGCFFFSTLNVSYCANRKLDVLKMVRKGRDVTNMHLLHNCM